MNETENRGVRSHEIEIMQADAWLAICALCKSLDTKYSQGGKVTFRRVSGGIECGDIPTPLGYNRGMPTFTAEQVRAARAFLGWTQVDLGQAANLSFETIRSFETSRFPLSPENHAAVRKAFKKAGVEFLKSGEGIGVTIPIHQQNR